MFPSPEYLEPADYHDKKFVPPADIHLLEFNLKSKVEKSNQTENIAAGTPLKDQSSYDPLWDNLVWAK